MSFNLEELNWKILAFMIIVLCATVFVDIIIQAVKNIWWDDLSKFPGPRLVAISPWYKTYLEVFCGVSWNEKLRELHKRYGTIVRVGPNELHFSNPSAYLEIYNNNNRWDKEARVYQSFAADHGSVSFLKYEEAKQRRDTMYPLFSHRSICEMQNLVQSTVDRFCQVLTENNLSNQSSDIFLGLRCWTIDTITSFCFATSVEALSAPKFRAPVVLSMEDSLPSVITFRHFPLIRDIITGMPAWLSRKISPVTAGLIDMQQMFRSQVNDIVDHPEKLREAPHKTIYHELMNPSASKGVAVTDKLHLYEEAQSLMFAGSDTVGNASMLGIYYSLENPDIVRRLKAEILKVWPKLDEPPRFETLEKLPYLTAVIKESLRIGPGGAAIGLPRVVPAGGATICGREVPKDTIVSIAASFVHYSEEIFDSPGSFNPDRWLGEDGPALEKWLVAFSKGPRMCLGQNLAYCELYLVFAALFRRFNMELDMNGAKSKDLKWRDCFVPQFLGDHLRVFCKPVEA
ncbi:hypothetical protein EAF04_002070 [Stromatinia cepivora]|nr:hypothetical protein EAF04_002070 [Stromatinia cepivora]